MTQHAPDPHPPVFEPGMFPGYWGRRNKKASFPSDIALKQRGAAQPGWGSGEAWP